MGKFTRVWQRVPSSPGGDCSGKILIQVSIPGAGNMGLKPIGSSFLRIRQVETAINHQA